MELGAASGTRRSGEKPSKKPASGSEAGGEVPLLFDKIFTKRY